MNNIIKLDHLDNLGSIQALWYIPTAHVSGTTRPIHGYGGITLSVNKEWLKLYFSPESASLSVDLETDSKGSFFKCVIKGVFPKQNSETDYSFRQMINQAFICKVLDANGKYYIIGTKDCPIRFNYGFESGEATADRNSFNFMFSGDTQYSPFFITSEEGHVD